MYDLLLYLEPDDSVVRKRFEDCVAGRIMCGECKQDVAGRTVFFLRKHQEKREKTLPVAREIVESGELGEIYYISCTRVNLGLFQPDINVIWDLAPHDISIILYILKQIPISLNAQGKGHFNREQEDVAVTTLNFANGTIAFIHTSWLDPDKIRRITIVGSKKMLVYNDISPNEKIKIFDKGVKAPPYYNSYAEFHFSYRYGDIYTPRLNEYEPLRRECEHFLDCIQTGKTPSSDGYSGLRIVSILEATDRSLKAGGAQQKIKNLDQPIKNLVA